MIIAVLPIEDIGCGPLPWGGIARYLKSMRQRFMPQEDVKKSICLSFPDFIFDPKCLPTPQRSLTGHPRAICYTQISEQISKSIFSHLPDNQTPDNQTPL
jgi:hypothetical protein